MIDTHVHCALCTFLCIMVHVVIVCNSWQVAFYVHHTVLLMVCVRVGWHCGSGPSFVGLWYCYCFWSCHCCTVCLLWSINQLPLTCLLVCCVGRMFPCNTVASTSAHRLPHFYTCTVYTEWEREGEGREGRREGGRGGEREREREREGGYVYERERVSVSIWACLCSV